MGVQYDKEKSIREGSMFGKSIKIVGVVLKLPESKNNVIQNYNVEY